MRAEIIARNYAETLMALAERQGPAALDEWGRAIDELAGMLATDPRARQFLETPRVRPEQKKEALRQALAGRVPELFVRFVMVLVDKRRQSLIPDIAVAYRDGEEHPHQAGNNCEQFCFHRVFKCYSANFCSVLTRDTRVTKESYT